LPKIIVEEVYIEYGDPDRDFKPVNLLRAEIARKILQGETASDSFLCGLYDGDSLSNSQLSKEHNSALCWYMK
jgi:hypothetical protein